MTPREFTKAYWAEAVKASKTATGVPALATLAQAAWESGWGRFAIGNMFFGVKDTDGLNGNEQLLTTTEYHSTPNVEYPVVISITPVMLAGNRRFKYKVKDYFRKYNTPSESFADHGRFLHKNPRYKTALKFKADPYKFIDEVAKAGYATDPNYAANIKSVMRMIEKYIK
jgi:flagellum-specific peptidoglycan hydrolase FlgJ